MINMRNPLKKGIKRPLLVELYLNSPDSDLKEEIRHVTSWEDLEYNRQIEVGGGRSLILEHDGTLIKIKGCCYENGKEVVPPSKSSPSKKLMFKRYQSFYKGHVSNVLFKSENGELSQVCDFSKSYCGAISIEKIKNEIEIAETLGPGVSKIVPLGYGVYEEDILEGMGFGIYDIGKERDVRLDELLGGFDKKKKKKIFRKLGYTLKKVHENDVFHRNPNLDNFTCDGKIVDFDASILMENEENQDIKTLSFNWDLAVVLEQVAPFYIEEKVNYWKRIFNGYNLPKNHLKVKDCLERYYTKFGEISMENQEEIRDFMYKFRKIIHIGLLEREMNHYR